MTSSSGTGPRADESATIAATELNRARRRRQLSMAGPAVDAVRSQMGEVAEAGDDPGQMPTTSVATSVRRRARPISDGGTRIGVRSPSGTGSIHIACATPRVVEERDHRVHADDTASA